MLGFKFIYTYMKYILEFQNFEDKITIDEYPVSVRKIYNKYSERARNSINDNLPKFAKLAKKVYYNTNKNWKDYFKQKGIKDLNNLSEVVTSIENWLKK